MNHLARAPFTAHCSSAQVPSVAVVPNCTIAVPSDKRLVVEFVSAEMYFASGKLAFLGIDYVAKGAIAIQDYNATDAGLLFSGLQYSLVSSPAAAETRTFGYQDTDP